MNDVAPVKKICGSAAPALNVMFVHGLTGDPIDTWSVREKKPSERTWFPWFRATAPVDADVKSPKKPAFWPNWLAEELPQIAVYTLGYSASFFGKWAAKEMNLHESANLMLDQFAAMKIGERPTAFITHSLGGLLTKEMLRVARDSDDPKWRRIAENTRLVMFLATPHTGASIASVLSFALPHVKSNFVALLSNESGYLTSLNQSYRNLANRGGLKTVAYYEKFKTKKAVIVVSRDSADPGVNGVAPVPVSADHESICKPESREAPVYLSIRRYLEETMEGAALPASPLPDSGRKPKSGSAPASETDPRPPPAKIVDLSALPDTSLVTLRGRDEELARLDVAWDNPSIHVFSVVAWGGQGKTALVSTWADRLKNEGGRGAEALLAWSFYSQGSKERATTADRFLDWALKKLDLPDPGPSATLKAEKIAEALQKRRVLLILDGLEPLQHGPGPQEGQLKDPAMRVLLRRAAADGVGGLILLTTRLAVQDIAGRSNGAAPVLDLSALSDEAGAGLLEDRGCKGPMRELRAAAKEFGGHALALTLLSGFLVKRHGGDVYRRDRVGPMVASERELNPIHAHARRVMLSMDEEWLKGAPLHAAIMRVIGLFDRPASADCLEALRRKPPLSGLTPWQAADDYARVDAISELREAGLLLREDEHAPDSLDAHPLAREWYGEKFKQENSAGFKAAHGRLYEHLRDSTMESDSPKDVAALEPLFQAIAHGCKAGRQQETLDEVYKNRICRRRPDRQLAYLAQHGLGAVGPSLAALAWFFDRPFETLHAGLTAEARAWVLGNAASFLGVLGRLREARDAQRAALEMFAANALEVFAAKNHWANAAIAAANLTEAELTLGGIAEAIGAAAQGVDFADKSAQQFEMLVCRVNHGNTLAAGGEIARARALRRRRGPTGEVAAAKLAPLFPARRAVL